MIANVSFHSVLLLGWRTEWVLICLLQAEVVYLTQVKAPLLEEEEEEEEGELELAKTPPCVF